MLDCSSGSTAAPAPKARGLLRGRRGSLLTWAAFLMVPLLGFTGLSIDTARGYLVRARLAQALDAAALAAGKVSYDQTKAQQEAQMVFKANFPTGYMNAALTGPTLTFNATSDTVTASASAMLQTYFMHLLGQDTVTVSGSSEVTRKTVFMDVVVSIDVSGSMAEYVGTTQKIAAARTAAQTLVDTLFGTSDTKDLLKMALVTWSANARILPIGSTYSSSATTSKTVTTFKNPYTGSNQSVLYYAYGSPIPLFSKPASGWGGCTKARYINSGTSQDGDLYIDYPTVNSKQWVAWAPAEQTITGYDKKNKPIYATMQCNNQGIQRLTNVKATITSAINNVTYPTGNTNLIMGLMWGWSVLGTAGPFSGDGTPPPAPGQGELVRAIVLMTDGDNTQAQTDAYEGVLDQSALDGRTLQASQKIKDAGIVIYAIRFGAGSNSEPLLKQVASGPSAPYYQYAPDAATLKAAFQEIGNHLSKLRISK